MYVAMAKGVKRLTMALFTEFGGRKGRTLSAFVDVIDRAIYLVPRDMEHIDFAALLLRTTSQDIQKNPLLAVHLLPITYELADLQEPVPSIVGMITAASGLEIGLGVRHRTADAETAHAIGISFAQNSDLRFHPATARLIIQRRYLF